MLPQRLAPDHFKPKERLPRTKTCGTCGREFGRNPKHSRQQWIDATFCSNACAQISPVSERLYASIKKDGQTGCWNWQGTKVRGYGRIVITRDGDREQVAAHRAAYTEWVGAIPKNLMVLHSCDNRACINPAHLRLGTHADNMADKVVRQRCRNQYGRPKKYASA